MTEHARVADGAAPETIPSIVRSLAGADEPMLEWRNELGGLTFRAGDRFIKWNPRGTTIDLARERVRLDWIAGRHPVPRVLDFGDDVAAQWLVTEALPGASAVADPWRTRPVAALRAIAAGLRALHALPIDDFPHAWTSESWVNLAPRELGERPPDDEPVLVHGDACAPNTLISVSGAWVGNVDFGALTIGDRWADLAIASISLDWNYGEGYQDQFFEAYGIRRDNARIAYYRALFDITP